MINWIKKLVKWGIEHPLWWISLTFVGMFLGIIVMNFYSRILAGLIFIITILWFYSVPLAEETGSLIDADEFWKLNGGKTNSSKPVDKVSP